ncbi:MAG: squalene synthase HpnC [Mariprofundaceae bacterium]|nr:squalene synthase HpnC [Mariprofundaceae bacterium]
MHSNDQTPPAEHVQTSYQHCMALARSHYENFPTASRLIRADLRPAVAAIYAFARSADDMADEGCESADKRLKQLDAWEVLLERCTTDEVDHPIFLALGDAIHRHALPVSCLHDLLTAFRMDVSIHAYSSFDELQFYCRHSANPVGRLVLALHNIDVPEALSASDAVCTALQLANFWQDMSIDLANGRCYLPGDWLAEAGLKSSEILQKPLPEGIATSLQPVMQKAIDFTDNMMHQGRNILPHLPLRLRLQIAATMRGGLAILHKTATTNTLTQRPRLGTASWLKIAPSVLFDVLVPRLSRQQQHVKQAENTP